VEFDQDSCPLTGHPLKTSSLSDLVDRSRLTSTLN